MRYIIYGWPICVHGRLGSYSSNAVCYLLQFDIMDYMDDDVNDDVPSVPLTEGLDIEKLRTGESQEFEVINDEVNGECSCDV